MKKNVIFLSKGLILAFAMIVFANNAYSQSGVKWATGLNSGSGTDAFGTLNYFPLIGKTNNTERFRITPDGNFGINVTNPVNKFEVWGNSLFTGNISLTGKLIMTSTLDTVPSITAQTIQLKRILPDDSLIHFGDSSVSINVDRNYITATSSLTGGITYRGLGFGWNAIGLGIHSIAIGQSTSVPAGTNYSIALGCGAGSGSNVLSNNISYSLMVGFNSNIPTLFVGKSSGLNKTGKIGIGMWGADVISKLHIKADGITQTTSSLNIVNSVDNSMLFVRDDGKVGIGTTDPIGKFQVQTAANKNICVMNWDIAGNGGLTINAHNDANSLHIPLNFAASSFNFYSGSVGIGTGYPYAKLDIYAQNNTEHAIIVRNSYTSITNLDDVNFMVDGNGYVYARNVKVKVATFYDYVLEKDYPLITLDSLSNYILINKHLPDIPSQAEVLNNGLDLGEFNSLLLKKIEEMYLYIIEQNKRIEALENKANNEK